MHFAPPTPSLDLPCAVPNFMAIPAVTANPHARYTETSVDMWSLAVTIQYQVREVPCPLTHTTSFLPEGCPPSLTVFSGAGPAARRDTGFRPPARGDLAASSAAGGYWTQSLRGGPWEGPSVWSAWPRQTSWYASPRYQGLNMNSWYVSPRYQG